MSAKTFAWDAVIIVFGVVGGFVGIVLMGSSLRSDSDLLMGYRVPLPATSEAEWLEIRGDVAEASMRVETLDAMYRAMKKPSSTAAQSAEHVRLAAEVDQLKKQIGELKAAVGSDSGAALSVPMLRKEMESVSTLSEMRHQWVRADIQRMEGLLLGMLVSVISLVVGAFLPHILAAVRKWQRYRDNEEG